MRRARVPRAKAGSTSVVVVVVCLLGICVASPGALAKFSGSGTGTGRAHAVLVAAPAAPTATFTGVSGLGGIFCTIRVSWTPAPPAGRQYTLYRVSGGTPTAIQSGISTATSYDDTFLLAQVNGNPSYFLRSALTGTTWTTDSTATASSC
jgi:hypothetical protein